LNRELHRCRVTSVNVTCWRNVIAAEHRREHRSNPGWNLGWESNHAGVPHSLPSGPKRQAPRANHNGHAANVIEHFSQTQGRNWVRRKSAKTLDERSHNDGHEKNQCRAPTRVGFSQMGRASPGRYVCRGENTCSASIAVNTPRRVLMKVSPPRAQIKISVAPITI